VAQLNELSGKPEAAKDFYEKAIKHTLNPNPWKCMQG
jgi:hypothetical protein